MFTFADAMKKTMVSTSCQSTTVERMLLESNLRQSIEHSLRTEDQLSDMERQDYINQINSLQATIKNLLGMIETLRQTLESVNASSKRNEELVKKLSAQIEKYQKQIRNLEERNRRHNKNTFGQKTHKGKKRVDSTRGCGEGSDNKAGRDEEKEDYDGSHGSSDTEKQPESSTDAEEGKLDKTKVKSEHLDEKRGPRGPYTEMDAAITEVLECNIDDIPKDMKFIGFKDVDEYDRISYVRCTRYKVAILVDKYGKRHDYFVPADEEKAAGRRPNTNIIPGTHGTLEMVADIASDLFQVLTPNYREGIRMRLDKFVSCDNTRMNWLKKGIKPLMPMLDLIKKKLLIPGSFVNIDETWEWVRIKFLGDGTSLGGYFKKYVWVLVNKDTGMVYFLYDNDENDSRGSRPINAFLGDFKGTIMSDAFVVYKQLTRDNPNLEHCLCWSHVLCKYDSAAEIGKEADAVWFQNLIRYLYLVENENIIKERTPDEIKKRRAEKDVTDTLNALHDRAEKLLRTKGDKYSDLMVTALNYMLNGWDELLNYRNDGRYTIDNLEAERTIRPITRVRKASLHHSSEEGLQMALAYMTIIESAKRLGHEVKDFLVRAWREAIYGNNDLEPLLQPAIATR
jgi:hypothetical protein